MSGAGVCCAGPMCKTVIMGAMSRFKIHRRSCNKERSDPIECEICGRKCDTLTGYTVHKLFHDVSKNKDSKNREKKVKEEKGLEKEEWICEQCGEFQIFLLPLFKITKIQFRLQGKTFKSISGYQCHILTIHTKTEEVRKTLFNITSKTKSLLSLSDLPMSDMR